MPNPPTYRTIAVASTFSPRFLQVLGEAKRMRDRFGSELRLIYVGPQSDDTNRKFADVLRKLDLPADLTIHYEEGDPSESILRALRENSIEMIVAGALEKEVVFHPFLGNVARQLVRQATCSVMLFTHPETDPKPFQRIVFVVDKSYSEHASTALQRTLQLAAAEKSERVYVIQIVTTFDEARASRKTGVPVGDKTEPLDEEEAALEEFVLSAGPTDVPLETRCIRGNTGFAAADFVQSVEADLLAVAVPQPSDGKPALPGNIAWITDVIPCNLWVIR